MGEKRIHNEHPPKNIDDIVRDDLKQEGEIVRSLAPKRSHGNPRDLKKENEAPENSRELLDEAVETDGRITRSLSGQDKKLKHTKVYKDGPHPENFIG